MMCQMLVEVFRIHCLCEKGMLFKVDEKRSTGITSVQVLIQATCTYLMCPQCEIVAHRGVGKGRKWL